MINEYRLDVKIPIEVGAVYPSKDGNYRVDKIASISKSSHKRYIITFENTGFSYEVSSNQIRDGNVKDYTLPRVFGVGYLGSNKSPQDKRIMTLWRGMLGRCYSPKNASYKNYGGKGVKVHKDWHNYTKFYEDVPNIQGYNEEEFYEGLLELDKDSKQQGVSKKVYSLETTVFMYSRDNISQELKDSMHRNVKGYSPEVGVVDIVNCSLFAEEWGMCPSAVYDTLEGVINGSNGWIFSKKELNNTEWEELWKTYFNNSRKKIEYKGRVYNSISSAARELKMGRQTIRKDINSGNGRYILP